MNPSIPIGHFSDLSGFGFGGNFQGEYKPGKAGITLNFGYIDYFGKTTNGISYSDFKVVAFRKKFISLYKPETLKKMISR